MMKTSPNITNPDLSTIDFPIPTPTQGAEFIWLSCRRTRPTICRLKPTMERLAIQMYTHLQHNIFFVGIWPSQCISSNWTTVHRTTAVRQRSSKVPVPLEKRVQETAIRKEIQKIYPHTGRPFISFIVSVWSESFLEVIYRRQQSFGKKIHENYRGRDHFICMMQ